jgi:glycosyltransferase involved in cell wall biosynthesis
MRIMVIGSRWVPVPPPAYGGTETVLDGLLRGLLARGHDVAYAGHPDSSAAAEVFGADPAVAGAPLGDIEAELAYVLKAHDDALAWGADLVHDNTLSGPFVARAPLVTTSHGPFDALTTPIFERIAARDAVVAISASQAAAAPTVSVAAVVHHGLDVASWPVGGGGDHVVFLGRMHPHKAPDRAIELARRAGVRLVLAAKMREPAEYAYFESCVKPLLHSGVEFIGEADAALKRELLGSARALLNPIRWPEPFGMVMLEALACGTPVVASPSGAAPEIVEPGVNGFLCADDDQFVSAIERAADLDRAVCRATVRQRFPLSRMIDGYLSVYEGRLSREPSDMAELRSARLTVA